MNAFKPKRKITARNEKKKENTQTHQPHQSPPPPPPTYPACLECACDSKVIPACLQLTTPAWGHEESDTTERLHSHSSRSCIGEGNGNPLQCSCLGNPRDGGAWLKNLPAMQETRFNPWIRKIPWKRKWQPTPVFLPGESQGRGRLVGCCL